MKGAVVGNPRAKPMWLSRCSWALKRRDQVTASGTWGTDAMGSGYSKVLEGSKRCVLALRSQEGGGATEGMGEEG